MRTIFFNWNSNQFQKELQVKNGKGNVHGVWASLPDYVTDKPIHVLHSLIFSVNLINSFSQLP